MSEVINLDFSIGDVVYHVNDMKGVRKGRVKDVKVTVMPSITTITYDITFIQTKYGSASADGTTLFADSTAAFAAYLPIIEST